MNWFLLQIDTSAAAAQAAAAVAPAQQISIIDLISKGGVLMIPLALLLVIALFVFFERLIYIRRASKNRRELHEHHPRQYYKWKRNCSAVHGKKHQQSCSQDYR